MAVELGKLIMANYVVPEEWLQPYLPAGTQLDRCEGRCYVSLVGFLFQDVRLKSLPIPFHRTFEEVNLRFYVQHITPDGGRRRGVVFISEFVPRLALTLVANTLYGENDENLTHFAQAASGVSSTPTANISGSWQTFLTERASFARDPPGAPT